MKGRRIVMLAVGDERVASVRYRVLAYRPALERAGFVPLVRFPLSVGREPMSRRVARTLDLVRDAYGESDCDLLFVHRKTYPSFFSHRLVRPGRPVVFDLDDALDLPPPGRQVGAATRLRYSRNFDATVRASDLVVCGSAELAARVSSHPHEILPTPVDTERFAPGAVPPPSGPVLGWVGHSDNLGYLEALAEPLREVAKRHPGLKLIVVADRPPQIPGLTIEFRHWRLEEELSCFGGIGVGLMPLEDSPWTRAKCAFKAIQYMALGIATVASPVGMSRDLIRDGEGGFLPTDGADWVRALDALLSDKALASRIGLEGRRIVERDYALDRVSRRFIGILELLISSRSRA